MGRRNNRILTIKYRAESQRASVADSRDGITLPATQSDATGLKWPLALRAPGLQLPTQDVFDGLSHRF